MPYGKILQMRNMDEYIPKQYKAISIAWPAEAIECAVYERADKVIDCLAEAVLRFIALGIAYDDDIARELNVHADLIKCVKNGLTQAKFIENGELTEPGEEFIKNDGSKQLFIENECFGYMFICMFNGEIMPYFAKGNLPELRDFHEGIAALNVSGSDKEESSRPSQIINKKEMLFSDAYKRYCKISSLSENDGIEDEIMYGREDFLFDMVEEESLENGETETTLHDAERMKVINKSAVSLLQNKGHRLYLETTLLINRRNPSDICLLSPFPENTTNWYNKKLDFFSETQNGIRITENNREISFSDFIRELRQTTAAEIPFELLVAETPCKSITEYYPALETAEQLNGKIKGALEEYHACAAAFRDKTLSGIPAVNTGAVLIETLLNSFIGKIENRSIIINSIQTPEHATEAFTKYGIADCWAERIAKDLLLKMTDKRKGWHVSRRVGNSITDRYFFLTLESLVTGKNPFGKILMHDGGKFINALDFIAASRNKYGSHNDEDYYRDIDESIINEFIEKHFYAVTLMINTLAEDEHYA